MINFSLMTYVGDASGVSLCLLLFVLGPEYSVSQGSREKSDFHWTEIVNGQGNENSLRERNDVLLSSKFIIERPKCVFLLFIHSGINKHIGMKNLTAFIRVSQFHDKRSEETNSELQGKLIYLGNDVYSLGYMLFLNLIGLIFIFAFPLESNTYVDGHFGSKMSPKSR